MSYCRASSILGLIQANFLESSISSLSNRITHCKLTTSWRC